MKIETKYNIGQEVFVVWKDVIHKRKVLDILILCETSSTIKTEYDVFGFTDRFLENEVFSTKEDLLSYLENNIKIDIMVDIMNDEENYYILDLESDKGIAQLEITTPHFAPYYYACFNILWLNDDEPYWWLDEENSTVTDILKNLEKSLDYFINS